MTTEDLMIIASCGELVAGIAEIFSTGVLFYAVIYWFIGGNRRCM
jgi:hypothetical protein